MNKSWKNASPEDKVRLLGEAFRDIEVTDFLVSGGVILTRAILGGKVVVLVGNPEQALRHYLLLFPDGQA